MTACAHRTGGRYCPDCGKDLAPAPYDRHTVLNDLAENWWEKGAIQTLAGLFVRPGYSIRTYIERDRDFLVKPIPYAAIIIAFVYWARGRIEGLGRIDTSDMPTLTLLMRDPLVPTVIAAVIGAMVLTRITHRPARLSLYAAFVLRLYLGAQALLLFFLIDVIAVKGGWGGGTAHDLARYLVSFAWIGLAIWQYFAGTPLRWPVLRAAAAVVIGEIAVFLLLIMPIVIIDELGWVS